MAQGSHYSRGVQLVTTAANVLGITDWERRDGDPDGLGLIARTFVWARWFIVAFGLVLWVYRSVDWLETYTLYVPGLLLLVGLNGYTHYRLATTSSTARGAMTPGYERVRTALGPSGQPREAGGPRGLAIDSWARNCNAARGG